jgi:hypothetical protein
MTGTISGELCSTVHGSYEPEFNRTKYLCVEASGCVRD